MNKIYKLTNKIKHYDWGSFDILPKFLGIVNDKNLPFAEMWMGTHPDGPSEIASAAKLPAQENGNLKNLSEITGELSFLFKLLAVQKPLSIQVHPNKEQAKEGFEREEKSGLSLDDPKRNYKDQNKKNEIICAITPFTLMAAEMEIKLQPLQALYIPCGVAHSHKEGFGIELMNNSNNVIRGGLTNKYVDIEEFNKIVRKDQFTPCVITPDESQSVFNYPIPEDDFTLTLIRGSGEEMSILLNTPAICIVTEGKVKIEGVSFKKGESFFLPKEEQQLFMEGNFVFFAASSGFNAFCSGASRA